MVKAKIPRDSRKGLKEREAILHIRYGSFNVKRPEILNKVKHIKAFLEVNVIYVQEK